MWRVCVPFAETGVAVVRRIEVHSWRVAEENLTTV